MKIAELTGFGISESVVNELTKLGFEELTEIQNLAVRAGLFEGKSLLVSAPTNTGKTFVGELAAITMSTRKDLRRTFFLVPLRALAEEQFEDLLRKYSGWGLKVAISTSDRTEFDDDLLDSDVIIATYEKLTALLIRNPNLLKDIGLVVIDELQNLTDAHRGPTIEMLLTRLLVSPNRPQIIGLSATMPNAQEVADWLEAKLVASTKRDVELREGIIYTGEQPVKFVGYSVGKNDFIYKEFNSGKVGLESGLGFRTTEGLAEASKSEQVLVFAETQPRAEGLGVLIADSLPATTETLEIIEELDAKVEPTPSTRKLRRILQNGVAFHHAGLLPEERAAVESGFKSGKIRIVCATTTLGAGVNTPAKDVVFRSHQNYEKRNIATREYKNMAGRAGRLRKDAFGRSILFADNEKELQMLWKEYVNASPELITSRISKDARLNRLLLGLVSSQVCNDVDQLLYFVRMTFFGSTYYQKTSDALRGAFDESIKLQVSDLVEKDLIEHSEDKLVVTELGKRCADEFLSPETAFMLFQTLKSSSGRIKGEKDFEKLTEGLIHLVCNTIDVVESSAILFAPRSQSEEQELQAYWEVHDESFFYQQKDATLFIRSLRTTRMLMRWIEGVPYSELSNYAPHGIIKRNAQTISWILRGLARIAEKPLFDFSDEVITNIWNLAERLFYGVPSEVLTLMRLKIPLVNRNRAVQLVNAGFKTIDDLIGASTAQLTQIPGVGDKTALAIKEAVERYIPDQISRSKQSQLRKAEQLGKSANHLKGLYEAKGEDFGRACIEILKDLGLNAKYVGDVSRIDGILILPEGNIALEGKRKEKDNDKIGSTEAEEVLGKSKDYKPISNVTFGYPDFSSEAKKNCHKSKISLVGASVLGDILIAYWEGKLSTDKIVQAFLGGAHISDISSLIK